MGKLLKSGSRVAECAWKQGCRTPLGSQRGTALVVVLMLAAISLSIMTALLYLVISGTEISGMSKNYKTAKEAGLGGTEIVQQIIAARGDAATRDTLLSNLNSAFNISSAVTTSSSCSGTSLITGDSYNGLAAKLMSASTKTDGTSNWTGCNASMAIDPNDSSTYDVKMTIGTATKYNVYAKVVNSVEGNTSNSPAAEGRGLWNRGVVRASGGGSSITAVKKPYIYTIEVDAENSATKTERAKLQILYQY